MLKRIICICCLGMTAPVLADAGSPASTDTTVYFVPPIVVKAKRRDPDAGLYNRSGFVAAFDLGDRKDRTEDLAAVLSQMVGVKVRQYGGLGDFATVSIRGSAASQVNIYLDGVPVNDSYSGVTNLADLPLGGVERVEVYRGFAPPQLGAGAIGGAVNLVSSDPANWGRGGVLTGLDVHASYGSFDTSRQQASAWLQPWKLRIFAHGSHTRTLGNFAFHDDNGTPVNTGDDETVDRTNNDFESYGGIGRVEADVPGFANASITVDAYRRDQGVAGRGTFRSATASYYRRRGIGHVNLETKPFFFNQLVLGGTGFYSYSNERYHDPEGTLELERQDTDNTISGWGGRAGARWFVPLLPVAIDAVVEQRTEEFHPVDNILDREGPDRWRTTRTAVVSADVYLIHQTLVLTGAQRWQQHTTEFWDDAPFPWLPPNPRGVVERDNRSPSAGLRWTPVAAVMFKGNIGRYQRLPTFLELFGNQGTVTGDATLEPEEGLNRDVGVILTFGRRGWLRRLYIETVYVDNEATNLILFFPNSQLTTKPTNIGTGRIKGWEFSAAAAIGAGFELSGNYTLLDTEDTSDIPYYNGNRLAGQPLHDAMAVASYRTRRWKLSWEAHYIGANFLARANLHEVAARNLHSAIAQLFMPLPGLSFTVEARNITDERASDVSGYPLPGRSFYTTLSYKR